jgi:hypothetical protein
VFTSSLAVYGAARLPTHKDLHELYGRLQVRGRARRRAGAASLRAGVHGILPASAWREMPPLNLANRLAARPAKPVRWRMEGSRARTTIRLMSCTHHPDSGFSKAWAQHPDGRE